MYRDASRIEFGQKSLVVVFDTDLSYDSEEFEEVLEERFKHLSENIEVFAQEINIGGGADWPAIAIETIDKYGLFAILTGAFFAGKKINENLDAWAAIGRKIKSALPKSGFTNRYGAAGLILDHVAEQLNCNDLQLIAYRSFDRFMDVRNSNEPYSEVFDIMSRSNSVALDDYTNCHGAPIHAFRLKIDDSDIVMVVDGARVVTLTK